MSHEQSALYKTFHYLDLKDRMVSTQLSAPYLHRQGHVMGLVPEETAARNSGILYACYSNNGSTFLT